MGDEDGSLITLDGRSAVSSDPTGTNFPWRPKSVKELLGDTLTGKDGPVAMSTLANKNLAIYFSAHWCPPCRGFTPKLVVFLTRITIKQARHLTCPTGARPC